MTDTASTDTADIDWHETALSLQAELTAARAELAAPTEAIAKALVDLKSDSFDRFRACTEDGLAPFFSDQEDVVSSVLMAIDDLNGQGPDVPASIEGPAGAAPDQGTPHATNLTREALMALMDERFPVVEPYVQRAPNRRGDDREVDRRDDERSSVEEFIDILEERGLLSQPSVAEPSGLFHVWENAYTSSSLTNANEYPLGTPEHEAHKEGAKARIKRGMTTRVTENPYPPAQL